MYFKLAGYLLFVTLIVTMNMQGKEIARKLTLDDLAITVQDTSREIGYTNKEAGHYYTLSNSYHTSGWQGWTVMDMRLLDDYQIKAGTYDLLRNRNGSVVSVKPHQLSRTYPNGTKETFTFLDSLDAFIVDVEVAGDVDRVSFLPRYTQSHDQSTYLIDEKEGILLISLSTYEPETARHPGWIAVGTLHEEQVIKKTVSGDDTNDMIDARTYAPAGITAVTVQKGETVRWIVAAGTTKSEVIEHMKHVIQYGDALIAKRAERMQRLLDDSFIYTSNARFNKALAWSRIAMDKLIMNQTGTGIYAGLPWFNNYWGRDTFISFSGGVLVTGQFEAARAILRSFAEFQDTDPDSETYGRVPNRVTTQEIIYNTTDGTPWFVREMYQYFTYSGDTALVKELYPVVEKSIEGALKNFTDDYYFLTHDDADTWMDAVGPDGPWSPRGNRAVDIQYLWYRQLIDGASMAVVNDDFEKAEQWREIAKKLRENFNYYFISKNDVTVYDRLKSDGTGDRRVRPNQIFAFDLVDTDDVRKAMLKTVIEELTYPWGVASLSLYDTDFHPFHHYPPYYVPDAAYHNGIVWTWLIGRVIEAAVQYDLQDLLYEVTDNMVQQILDRGGVGTFSELLDAFPRSDEDEPHLSGTFTQAWNLAEFIRNAYQDYLGIRVHVPDSVLTLTPKLPRELGDVHAKIPFGKSSIQIIYANTADSVRVSLSSDDIYHPVQVNLRWVLEDGAAWNATGILEPDDSLIFEFNTEQITITPGTHADFRREDDMSRRAEFAGISLAQPEWQDHWKSLEGPDHPLLTHAVVKNDRGDAQLLFDVEDEKYDDAGPDGTYEYPTNPNFRDGILDLARFSVWKDDEHTYFRLRFRNLHDPGFHPHYGFQLTYAAILIDRGSEGPGMDNAGANSQFIIEDTLGVFDRAIYVGGGIRVVDADHEILCEYLPAPEDVTNPLGNVKTNEISFAIPNVYIGDPEEQWRYLVLVGAQDDHGGAGIGVFRDVRETAGEWHGGGKVNSDDPNVYDVLMPKGSPENR